MKQLTLLFVLLMFISSPAKAVNNDKKNDANKKRVLLVSFIENNFYTTYDKAEVAKTNEVEEEKVLKMLDEKVSSVFANSEEGVEFVNYEGEMENLTEKVTFSYNEDEFLVPDISLLSNEEFNKLLADNNVDYVIFINSYEMKWIGDPQYKLDNEIHYSIFKKDKEAVIEGKHTFSTPKLVPVVKMDKKYKKAVAKICSKFLKNS